MRSIENDEQEKLHTEAPDQKFILDATFVAAAFNMTEADVRAQMARGSFKSLVEKGIDDDAGSWRLTLRCGNRTWQGVLSADGAIGQQTIRFVPAQHTSGR